MKIINISLMPFLFASLYPLFLRPNYGNSRLVFRLSKKIIVFAFKMEHATAFKTVCTLRLECEGGQHGASVLTSGSGAAA